MPFLHDIREWLEAPVQDSIHIGDGDAVVGNGHGLVSGALHAVLDFPAVEHTTAAVDDQGIRRQVFREIAAAGRFDADILMRIITKPAGNLDRADVVALAMMGTAFGNEDRVAVLQLFQGRDAADGRFQQALVPGHEDGE